MNLQNNLDYNEIKIGDENSFTRTISKHDMAVFAELSGDFNPLHMNEEFGKKSPFKKNIVHGMMAGSLFSTLVGMHCPGQKSLYMSQTLNFRLPIYPGETVIVKGIVAAKNDSIKMIILKTQILKKGSIAIDGEAKIKVL